MSLEGIRRHRALIVRPLQSVVTRGLPDQLLDTGPITKNDGTDPTLVWVSGQHQMARYQVRQRHQLAPGRLSRRAQRARDLAGVNWTALAHEPLDQQLSQVFAHRAEICAS